ncbi:hypothetical protein Ciccas_006064 [Cichlidogyrus casuarinus]|uniref:Death domain-containing protein n=1 Tax=Cichlidogyrus casuarinus TaxID=1844966 RepID=A0ABD2Q6Z4_9PLAT
MDEGGPKRREDDCEMASAMEPEMNSKEEQMLFEAAKVNNILVISRVLKDDKCDINCRNNYGRTALIMAAARGSLDAVETLCELKANVELVDKFGMSALFWAAYYNHTEVAKYIILRDFNFNRRSKQGTTLAHICAKTGDKELLNLAIQRTKNIDLNAVDELGQTPFIIATSQGNLSMMEFLGQKRVNIVTTDKEGRNCLHYAAVEGQLDSIKFCMSVPCLKILQESTDEHGKTPLIIAIEMVNKRENGFEIVQELLRNQANPNFAGEQMRLFPLMEAAKVAREDVVALLLEYGADIELRNSSGNTALHVASLSGTATTARLLLKNGSDLEARNNRLQTPLHAAVEQSKLDTAEILLLAGARLDVVDKTAKTPLMLAARSLNNIMVDMIIKADRLRELDGEFCEKLSSYYTCAPKAVLYLDPADIRIAQEEEQISYVSSGGNSSEDFSDSKEDTVIDKSLMRKSRKKPPQVNKAKENVIPIDMQSSEEDKHSQTASLTKLFNPDKRGSLAQSLAKLFRTESVTSEVNEEKYKTSTYEPTLLNFFKTPAPSEVGGADPTLGRKPSIAATLVRLFKRGSLVPADEVAHQESTEEDSVALMKEESVIVQDEEDLEDEDENLNVWQSYFSESKSVEQKIVLDEDGSVTMENIESEVQAPTKISVGRQPSRRKSLLKKISLKSKFRCKSEQNPINDMEVLDEKGELDSCIEGHEAVMQELIMENGEKIAFIEENKVAKEQMDDAISSYRLSRSWRNYASQFEAFLYILAHKKLHKEDWRKLAHCWDFKEEHLIAIEFDDSKKKNAYKSHGYRVLVIWFHGLKSNTVPTDELRDALNSIGRKKMAMEIKSKLEAFDLKDNQRVFFRR